MNMSFGEKMLTIFTYIFSSFLSIELFVLCLLLFLLLLFNLKYKNKYVNMILVVVYLAFIGMVFISSFSYVRYSVDSLLKKVMHYIYFPSTVVYFFIVLFSIFMILYSMFNKNLSKFKKVFNYSLFSFMIFFFLSFVSVCSYSKADLSDLVSLYTNETILSIVQISNLLLFSWFIYTFFYKLYCFFKNHFDNKN